ncbi:MAG: hypothetical protein HZB68_01785, partial [Candidatus Aenigmarchaeota archaeon]|nr:hypothetical protein [Candidatus Aenigmarchaeota archaeon]
VTLQSEAGEFYVTGHCAKSAENLVEIMNNGGCDEPYKFFFNYKRMESAKTYKNVGTVAKAIINRDEEKISIDMVFPEYLEFAKKYAELWEEEFGEGKATIFY